MPATLHYRVYCITDAQYEYVWLAEGDAAPTTCPVNAGHTIDGAQTAVIDKSGADAKQSAKGVLLTQPQPQTPDWEMCNKDIRIVPGKFAQADAVQDLKVNISTKQEVDWSGPELTLVGVYKSDGTACIDQSDSDTNGVLTIFDYKAIDQKDGTTEIAYDVRGGSITADSNLPGGELWNHKAYLIIAPDIPAASGGSLRLFDGYLRAGGKLEEISPQAKNLDPATAAGANVMRIYIIHPATGGVFREHLLRLLTYRATTTT